MMSTETNTPLEALYTEADQLLRSGLHREARDVYLEITSTFANEFLAVKGLAMTSLSIGDLRGAVESCRLVLQVCTDDIDCLIILASVYNIEGDVQTAERLYKKVLTLDPTAFDAHFNLACLYYTNKRWAECLPEFALAQKYSGDPNLGAEHVTRAKLNLLLQQ